MKSLQVWFFCILCIATSNGQDQCSDRDESATCNDDKSCSDTRTCKKISRACECVENCGWSCVRKGCQILQAPDNGDVLYELENRTIGSTATFSCSEGYLVSGNARLKCLENKTWNASSDASCTLDCPIRLEEPGRDCMKTCHSDTDCLNQRECVCDGVCGSSCIPTRREPYCDLIVVDNAEVTLNTATTVFGTIATITCSPGYLQGHGATPIQRHCVGIGEWSDESPTCIPDDACRDPPEIENTSPSRLDKKDYYIAGEYVIYSCLPGYARYSGSRLQCTNGNWLGTDIDCRAKNCGHPGYISDGRIQERIYTFPNSVTYVCDDGFKLSGSGQSTRHCQATQVWTGTKPSCISIHCPSLSSAPVNGRKQGSGTGYEDQVLFTCDEGFSISGESRLTCQNDETWSADVPECTPYCPNPPKAVQWVMDDHCKDEEDMQANGCGLSYRCNSDEFPINEGIIWTCERGVWREDFNAECETAVPNSSCDTTNLGFREFRKYSWYGRLVPAEMIDPFVNNGTVIRIKCPEEYQLYGGSELIKCEHGDWKPADEGRFPVCSSPE